MKKIKRRKSEGNDGIVVELVETPGEFAIDKLTDIAHRIYFTRTIPQRIKESEFIVIPLNVGAVDGSKSRTISIMSKVAKGCAEGCR